MGKYKAKEIKDLSDYVKENRNKFKTRHGEIQAAKTVTEINHENRGIYNRTQTQTSRKNGNI